MVDRIWLKSYPPGMPADIDPDQFRSIPDLFEQVVRKLPPNPRFTTSVAR